MATSAPRNSTGKMVGAFFGLAAVVAGELAGYLLSLVVPIDPDVSTTMGAAVAGVAMVALLGGGSYLTPSLSAIGKTFRFLWWILLVSAVLMVWDLTEYLIDGEVFSSNWPPRFLETLALCLAIGVSEEAEFRGLVFGGFLAKLGGSRRSLMIATLVTALLFGAAHISWEELNWADPFSLAQMGLKILQTGMYSVMLSAVMLITRNITGAMLFHAIDDFLLFVVSTAFFDEGFETEYVTTASEEDARITIIFYLIICALYLPTFIKAIRALRHEVEVPNFGPFVSIERLPEGAGAPGAPSWQQGAASYAAPPAYGPAPVDMAGAAYRAIPSDPAGAAYGPVPQVPAGAAFGPVPQVPAGASYGYGAVPPDAAGAVWPQAGGAPSASYPARREPYASAARSAYGPAFAPAPVPPDPSAPLTSVAAPAPAPGSVAPPPPAPGFEVPPASGSAPDLMAPPAPSSAPAFVASRGQAPVAPAPTPPIPAPPASPAPDSPVPPSGLSAR